MISFINKYKDYLEYVPVCLFGLLLISEYELEKHASKVSCQIAIMILVMGLFFLIVLKFRGGKIMGFSVCLAVWIALVYAKRKFFLQT